MSPSVATPKSIAPAAPKDPPPPPPPPTTPGMNAAITTTTKHFRILDLPAELHLHIYVYYFETFTPPYADLAPITHINYGAPLLNICQLIRTEAAKLYYARLKEVVPEFKLREDEMWHKAEIYLRNFDSDIGFDWNEYESIKFAARQATFESSYAQRVVDREVEILRKDGYEVKMIERCL